MPAPRAPRVLIAEPFAESGAAVLRHGGVEVVPCIGATRAELAERLHDADGLIVRSETRVDRALLESARRLRVIARAGVGVDAIDVAAATEAGIVVVNTPSANTIAATEHTFALLLALMRNVALANAALLAGRWERAPFAGNELFGKTLGIVGLGRIGSAVALRAGAFGMNVLACDPFIPPSRAEAVRATLLELHELLNRSDIVTLHVPHTPQTDAMIDADALRLMRPHAVLVNCARGAIVDEPALLHALDAGTIRAAAIDVVAHEPPPADSPGARLHCHPRVLATPHLGGSTHEALERIAVELATDVVNVLNGRPASGAVNAPAPQGADADVLRPFVDLAYRMGVIVPQLYDDALRARVVLELRGDIADADAQPLRVALLSGLLQTTSERRVSMVNAETVAHEAGIELDVRTDPSREGYTASIAVVAGARRLVGIAVHREPRIVEIDGFEIDAIPRGALIVTHHRDVPGMVGRVGMLLGAAEVNISTMQVARDARGGDAVMVLAVDRAVDRDELAQLTAIAGMHRVVSLVV